MSSSDTPNHIGILLENANKHRRAAPSYDLVAVSLSPPVFRCTLRTSYPANRQFSAEASTQKDAKSIAAQQACMQLNLV